MIPNDVYEEILKMTTFDKNSEEREFFKKDENRKAFI